ncbi:Transcription factor MYB75 [Entamoeba marina]
MNSQITPKPPASSARQRKIVRPWCKQEDEILITAVERYGKSDWDTISCQVPNRTKKQCKERYFNHLDEDVHKSAWTQEEDELILLKRDELGNRWTEISKYIPGRAPNSIKNRYFSHLTRVLKKKSMPLQQPKLTVNGSPDSNPFVVKHVYSVFKPVLDKNFYQVL